MQRWVLVAIVVLAGCGRLGFDPTENRTADAPSDPPSDAGIPGLVALFPFDDDPTDGIDNRVIGGPLAACVSTCPTVVPGKGGRSAYQFNGTSDAIRFPDIPQLHTPAGTIAFWIRFAGLPGTDQFMVMASKAFDVGDRNSWEVFLHQTSGSLNFVGGGDSAGNAGYAADAWTAGANTWVHVAMTWGTKIRIYANGAMVAELADPGRSFDSGGVYLGSDFDNGAVISRIEGALDEVYLFSGELTANEIMLLAGL